MSGEEGMKKDGPIVELHDEAEGACGRGEPLLLHLLEDLCEGLEVRHAAAEIDHGGEGMLVGNVLREDQREGDWQGRETYAGLELFEQRKSFLEGTGGMSVVGRVLKEKVIKGERNLSVGMVLLEEAKVAPGGLDGGLAHSCRG